MRALITCIFVLLGTVLAVPYAVAQSNAAAPAERVYTVSGFIFENGALIGAPTITVREGDTATMTTRNGAQYALELRIDTPTQERLAGYGAQGEGFLEASARVHLPEDGLDDWQLIAAPQILTRLGQRASVEVDTSGRHHRRESGSEYTDQIRLDLVISEVDESWFDQQGLEKSTSSCTIDTIDAPKASMGSSMLLQAGGDCCDNGCIRCCGGCCSDSANCRAGCCP